MIPEPILRVLIILAEKLEPTDTSRAVTGSTCLALQEIDLVPNDIDVLTDEAEPASLRNYSVDMC